ncbi:MAG: Stk1 family PASTA domain-containing Ser/Thr kinase [Kineosporiaceae bacterium]
MDPVNDNPRVLGNRYELGELLGRGGMAEVHMGRDTRLGRVVAIKLLRTDLARDATFQARFRREAQSAAGLNHPAIVAVYDTGEEQVVESGGAVVALPYIVMEYVEGRTLRELMHDGRPLEVDTALDVTARVLSALEYSHRSGIVHRDIKPANVMVTPSGDVKVMDFGIARAMADSSSTMTQTHAVIGTAQYLSPEQARGETVDARSDLYSAGCLLYELLTGRPPFVADSPVAVAYQHVREEPQPPSAFNPAVPEAVDQIVLHALAKDLQTRYQSAADFRADLEAALAGRPVSAFAGSAAAGAATTQFLGAAGAGTRTMQPVTDSYDPAAAVGPPTSPVGGGLLPGTPMGDDYGYGTRRDGRPPESRRGRGWSYALLGLAILLVAGLVAYTISKINSGPSTPTKVSMPSVVNLPKEQAVATLTQAGFTNVNADAQQASDKVPSGDVLSQDPASGQLVEKTAAVTLVISSGKGTVTVPSLQGLSQDDAIKALQDQGLTLAGTSSVDDPKYKANQVVRSDPAAGTSVPKGTGVKLVLATGLVNLPNLVGTPYTEAVGILAGLNLKYPKDPQQADDPQGRPTGTVIAQSAQGEVKIGTTVTLTVSKGSTPPPTSSPTPSPSSSPTGQGSPPPSTSPTS